MTHIAANLYLLIIAATILFQLCLIAGAPWGRYTQGGQHESKLPTQNRISAAVSISIVLAMAAAVTSAAGLWPHWPRWTAWAVLALQMLSTGMNWIAQRALGVGTNHNRDARARPDRPLQLT